MRSYNFKRAGHTPYKGYLRFWEPAINYVATIRNPWDRVASSYEYFKQKDQTFDEYMKYRKREMMRDHIYTERKVAVNAFAAQTTWLTGEDGEIDPSIHLLRFEQLQDDWDALLQKWGMETTLIPHLNTTERRPYQEYYLDNRWQEIVAGIFKDDVTNFGYTFDGN